MEGNIKNIKRAHWYFLFVMLLQVFIARYSILERLNITDMRLGLLVSHTVAFIIPGIVYIKFVRKESLKGVLRLNKLNWIDSILIILLGFTCQPVMMFISLISQFFFENTIGQFIGSIMSTPYIILILLVAVLPSISEEITIRGIVLDGYKDKNIYVASIMTGLLFGIMHLNPQQFLYTAVLGVVLALVVRITNSIYSAVIIHFIVNGTSITLQKILEYFTSYLGNGAIVEEATEISLKSLPILDKVIMAGVYGVIAMFFGAICFLIVNKLYKDNIKRGTIGFRSDKSNKEEKVINTPFILILLVYIGVMIFFI